MAECYGGAKPKTRICDRNTGNSQTTKGESTSLTFSQVNKTDAAGSHKCTFSAESGLNDNCYKCMTGGKENIRADKCNFLKRDEGTLGKGTRMKSKEINAKQDNTCVNANDATTEIPSSGLRYLLSQGNRESIEGIRLQEIGKLSKDKEQEYLSAREKWKKSGLALRKYIAEKLGFKQEESKKNSFDSVKRQENSVKRKTENIQFAKKRNNLPRSRSENLKDESSVPRSRSFLRYFGFGKENDSTKVSQNGMKSSKSFDASSSDAWPESSTDTCKSTSDWSADNTLTNQSSDNNIWMDQKSRSTQTQVSVNCKCKKEAKAKKAHECKHKSKSQRHLKKEKSKKDSSKKECIKIDQSKKIEKDREKRVGILDDEIRSSSEGDEEFEYVLDPDYGEVVRRAKSRKLRSSGGHSNFRNTDSGSRGSQEITDSTYEALLTLHHAIPYLPESFRNRLQSPQADQRQVSHGASNSNSSEEVTLKDTKVLTPRENTDVEFSRTGDRKLQSSKNSTVDRLRQTKTEEKNSKKLNKDKKNWRRRLSESDKKGIGKSNETFDMIHVKGFEIEDFDKDLENSLEDPFNVRSDSKIDLCSGLMDLVREIDIPFIDEDGEAKFDKNEQEKDHRQIDVTDNYYKSIAMPDICNTNESSSELRVPMNGHLGQSSSANSGRQGANCMSFLNFKPPSETREATGTNRFDDGGFYRNKYCSPETSFEDDPDFPGMRTLNDSFNRLLGEDDTDTSTDSSVLHNFIQRSSRSDESGSRSKSSDDSIEADDEFECECEHCQLLRQHSYGTNNLDLLPPRLYTEDMGFPYDLESSATGQSDTDHNTGFRSAMFLEDYDFLLDRSNNELDWLIVDSRPLSLMLEDVIQQMLAVQPELLSEQAAPPAPQIVIENLPTIPLTLSHIDQHPSCPICLCLCEVEELMTLLPCQHLFHPICIEAWLIKSGTCPVCRAKLNR